ncbi:hypothetical protein LSAT2_030023 [Lamellibrachia satsuma]|nr:hypothetical protein LSAT2_030023 [Lamellibrachia satsuma]
MWLSSAHRGPRSEAVAQKKLYGICTNCHDGRITVEYTLNAQVVKFDCGMDEKNPLESVLFYDKNNPETAKSRISKEPVSPMLPTTFCECILRFFWKKSDANPNIGRQAFKAWLKESEDWWNSEEFWKRSV